MVAVPQAPGMTAENKAAATESSAKQTDVTDLSKETTPSDGELFRPAYTQENFQEWPLQVGVALALFAVLVCMVFFVLLQRLNRLDDKEWLNWIKPLLQRLKIALLGPEPVKDTESFTEALEIWHPLIALKDPTPRTIKAFLNRLRYLVSRRASELDSDQETNGQEAQLVALAAISYVYWKDFDEILGHMMNQKELTYTVSFVERWPDLEKKFLKHHEKFGEFPSQEDIKFYKSMIQNIQIHRPD